ncbi:hypothetical protein SUGI_1087790 [Cryptomeria japonica]|nr:hypothetical protein SUGI_1087790 [Cryptomeria japonica]
MATVYTTLARRETILAWVILGNLLLITLCGTVAFIHQSAMFAVGRARFHRLCGVPPGLDDIVEALWEKAEHCGILSIIRKLDDASHDAIEGDVDIANQGNVDEASHNAIVPIS